jgi:predicted ATPase
MLLRCWAQAKQGSGQAVLLAGEPGIGKSRLTAALLEQLEPEPHMRLRYFCTLHHQDSALFPLIAQLERAAGFEPVDTPERRLTKLEVLLAVATLRPEADVPLFAELLSIPPIAGRYAPLTLTPQQKKVRTLDALLRQLQDLARHQPVLTVFEDAHWIDPTSRELLDLIFDALPGLPVLLS